MRVLEVQRLAAILALKQLHCIAYSGALAAVSSARLA